MISKQLEADQKQAMRDGDRIRLQTIRSLRAALTDREIELRQGGVASLSEDEEQKVIQRQAKQRRDSIEQFEQAGREDLAERERDELRIIESYLPAQLSDEELATMVDEVILKTEASSPSDIGKVMGPVMAQTQGRADGKRVNAMVRERLAPR
jgi:uncharacterized protein